MNIDHEYPEGKAIESWWEENVYCSILQVARVGGHFCGYARFPKRPVIEPGYHGILTYAPVHGGITYAREADDGSMVYGFDCAHADDEMRPELREGTWLKDECRKLVGSILAAAIYEAEYLLAATNETKAEILDKYHKEAADNGAEFVLGDNFGAMINLLSKQL